MPERANTHVAAACPPFHAQNELESLPHASTYRCYLLLDQIPGGYLAKRYGGKIILAISFLLGGPFSALTALPAGNSKYVVSGVVLCRLAVGIAQGLFLPAAQSVLAHWIPAADRGPQFAIAMSGMFAGPAAAMVTVPILGESGEYASGARNNRNGMFLLYFFWSKTADVVLHRKGERHVSGLPNK